MEQFSDELALNKKIFTKAWLVLIWEELETTLGSNLELFQQMFEDLEYKQFCKIISHLENWWLVTIDLNSIQKVDGFPFSSLVRRFEQVSLDDIKNTIEFEFQKETFDRIDVYSEPY